MTNALKERSGVVYTKSWVVELILDLAGYCKEFDLGARIAVEPAAGDGAFLLPMVDRLLASTEKHGRKLADCKDALIAFELDETSAERARSSLVEFLTSRSVSTREAKALATSWLRTGDFLLDDSLNSQKVDFVIGNPPYIRLEDLNPRAAVEYRENFKTMVGRADIYIAFFEAALERLAPGGVCGYICADRWMRNQYGSALRKCITSDYSVETVIEMHNADAFESDVSAYPAITIIRRAEQGPVVVANLEPGAEKAGTEEMSTTLDRVRKGVRRSRNIKGLEAARIDSWFHGSEPWACGSPEKLALLKRLEAEYHSLESAETQTVVGIGVATGADKIYITTDPEIVEESRLLPMAMAYDFKGSKINWSGHYLVNPWDKDGLVELDKFPRLAAYLENNVLKLKGRHIAQKNPKSWYRTIDRVNHKLIKKKKLYIPDIKDRITPVLDDGNTYPHHNLYFIQSDGWDMEVLGGLLLSSISQLFVECYAVRMRGGYLRFQAQYLRRIRVPRPADISHTQAKELREAFRQNDVKLANKAAFEVYKVDYELGESLGYR